ncbi:MAG: DEAD/DEAH box helicase [Balneolaceae bacterium]
MSTDTFNNIEKWLDQAARSLEAEIETVRERPSEEVLKGGRPATKSSDETDFIFETHQTSIRFAEEVRAEQGDKNWTVEPVSCEGNEVTLRFPKPPGIEMDELFVEWENDFVLKRLLEEIRRLEGGGEVEWARIDRLFDPVERDGASAGIVDDGRRNEAQAGAIRSAMEQSAVFIWGPPGTGKTDSLGFVMANYLRKGKSVLFASNTNRAVDVGLLSLLDALECMGMQEHIGKLTRFGDLVLEEPRLEPLAFENRMENLSRHRQQEAAEWVSLLERREQLTREVEQKLRDGVQPNEKQKQEMELIEDKVRRSGGLEVLQERVDRAGQVQERVELRKYNLVATTLAKVCTSELFWQMDFDAVVIDEGSMASLPYLMVLAAKAREHTVVVGDPMQLPPIALTEAREARHFLEQDIFTTVSGATTTGELFLWHDRHRKMTAFFDTQYRLRPALAELISNVFYEGRLKSAPEMSAEPALKGESLEATERSCHLIDTSPFHPMLERNGSRKGFQPVNEVHQQVLVRLLRRMLGRGISAHDIGVMVPFRGPVYDLKEMLWQEGIRDIEVGTIHTFQGREKPYIIFDTVMTGERQGGAVRHYSVRPLDEEKNGLTVPRLLNVAFSRSRKVLMVIADMDHIEEVYGGKFLGQLLQKLEPLNSPLR